MTHVATRRLVEGKLWETARKAWSTPRRESRIGSTNSSRRGGSPAAWWGTPTSSSGCSRSAWRAPISSARSTRGAPAWRLEQLAGAVAELDRRIAELKG